MRNRIAPVLFVAAALLAGASQAASLDKDQTVKLDRTALVGGSVVPPGTYRIKFASGPETAKFVQGKRTIAEVPCKVGLADVVYPGTAVHYRTDEAGTSRVTKIVFSSTKLAVEFPTAPAAAEDATVVDSGKRR